MNLTKLVLSRKLVLTFALKIKSFLMVNIMESKYIVFLVTFYTHNYKYNINRNEKSIYKT